MGESCGCEAKDQGQGGWLSGRLVVAQPSLVESFGRVNEETMFALL